MTLNETSPFLPFARGRQDPDRNSKGGASVDPGHSQFEEFGQQPVQAVPPRGPDPRKTRKKIPRWCTRWSCPTWFLWWVFGVNLRLLIFGDAWWCLDGKFFKGTSKRTFGRKISSDDNTWAAWNEDETPKEWFCNLILLLGMQSDLFHAGFWRHFMFALLGSQPDRWLWWGFTMICLGQTWWLVS